MNILTQDLISVIASRNYSIIKHKLVDSGRTVIVYKDENGNRHRIDGPAVIWNDNDWYWYFHGRLHRSYKPASMNISSYYKWYHIITNHMIPLIILLVIISGLIWAIL